MGEFIVSHWTATARLRPGSPRSIKVLARNGPPASMGAWSSGYSPDKWTEILHQAKQRLTEQSQTLSPPRVKQCCVIAPTLFGIFLSLVLCHAFRTSEDVIYIHTRSEGKLFDLARLKAKSKIRKVLIRELLFVDDGALTSHSAESLQRFIYRFAVACKEFGLTISIRRRTSWVRMSATLHPSTSTCTP